MNPDLAKMPSPRFYRALASAFALGLALCSPQALLAAEPTSPKAKATAPASTGVVKTAAGPVRGITENSVRKFLGIPYAAPPTADLRWTPPQPPQQWTEPRETTAFGGICPAINTLYTFASKSENEDCLYLNVFTPGKAEAEKLPVMVWLYGGALIDGESDSYDPTKIVTKGNVIVVTLNYRVNAFGFLALPTLDKEDHALSNYGLMDQQYALKWVQDNITEFGGDPDNVTLFGESAGALTGLANVASPTAKGLFHRAILASPARNQKLQLEQIDLADFEERGAALAKAVGCEDLDMVCLRAVPVDKILEATASYESAMAVDGTILTKPLGEAFRAGDFNRVPIIIGSNKDEGRFSVAYKELTTGEPLTVAAYQKILEMSFGGNSDAVSKSYPLVRYDSPSTALSAILTDSRISCPVQGLAGDLQKFVPTYTYEFADRTAPFFFPPVTFPYGAAHTAELQYLFQGYHGASGIEHELNDMQQKLSDQMVGYWAGFAHADDPNGGNRPEWPRFSGNDGSFQILKLPAPYSVTGEIYSQTHNCELWSKLEKAEKP